MIYFVVPDGYVHICQWQTYFDPDFERTQIRVYILSTSLTSLITSNFYIKMFIDRTNKFYSVWLKVRKRLGYLSYWVAFKLFYISNEL